MAKKKRGNGASQWTAQFLVAAKLCRAGYTVAFTMGNNTPMADMLVTTPDGRQFSIDVKGMGVKASWWVQRKEAMAGLFYVLVYIDNTGNEEDRYFIATQAQYNEAITAYMDSHPKAKKDSLSFSDVFRFEDQWGVLPQCQPRSPEETTST
jgi:hypothetical protein